MEKKRILIVTTTEETLATILVDQDKYLSSYFEVGLACCPQKELAERKKSRDAIFYAVPMKRGISPVYDIYSIVNMIFVILRFKPDIVHSYTPKAGLIAMTASWICRTRFRIHTFTGLIFPTSVGVKRALLLFIDKLIAYFSTHIVPESEGVRRDLIENGILSPFLKVIGSGNIAGVDTSYFKIGERSFPRRSGNDVSPFTFVYVGRINRDKGINELVGAFTRLSGEARLVLVGALDNTAPPDPSVLKRIESHPLIFTTGFQSDIRPYLNDSHVLVLPSYREGFPNVVLQAMSMRLPVISTNVSGANEVVIPDQTGWLVPIKDEESLTLAMLDALNTPVSKLVDMGWAGRQLVEQKFERTGYLRELIKFYFSLN